MGHDTLAASNMKGNLSNVNVQGWDPFSGMSDDESDTAISSLE